MKDLEKYLRENAPETPEEGQFLIEMNARLSNVEGIKQTVDAEHRRWKRVVVISLVAGLVLGCALSALVWLCPVRADASAWTKALQTLQEWKPELLGLIAVCSISLGVLSLKKGSEFSLLRR